MNSRGGRARMRRFSSRGGSKASPCAPWPHTSGPYRSQRRNTMIGPSSNELRFASWSAAASAKARRRFERSARTFDTPNHTPTSTLHDGAGVGTRTQSCTSTPPAKAVSRLKLATALQDAKRSITIHRHFTAHRAAMSRACQLLTSSPANTRAGHASPSPGSTPQTPQASVRTR
ncbi:hypothetical protein DES53_11338 [Roseimicrobium gellanilyticum]|uniref:Uncharacterized protein n=1 Tax=Roseimicrobium gellanilyticum TaxID=748857 RepID=A0A366H7W7_9BACT|nr:hypothetical protein DES53_11338 [Roseimicrobium gellanilyticum]